MQMEYANILFPLFLQKDKNKMQDCNTMHLESYTQILPTLTIRSCTPLHAFLHLKKGRKLS